MARGRAAGTDVACSGQKEKARASAVPDAGGVLRQRDEVKAMAASGTIARASLLWPAFTT
jgi:hypothetical protein